MTWADKSKEQVRLDVTVARLHADIRDRVMKTAAAVLEAVVTQPDTDIATKHMHDAIREAIADLGEAAATAARVHRLMESIEELEEARYTPKDAATPAAEVGNG